jgi:hypothetical protein
MKRLILTIIALITCIVTYTLFAEGNKCPTDRLVITAKFTEIPGTGEFPKYPKGSVYYNHVAILKYEVEEVHNGDYDEDIIMVGQYMPRLARSKIKDKMDQHVDGDLEKFEPGDYHKLVLDKPIKKYWDRDDAVFDDYFDDEEGDRYFALRTDLAKKGKE